MCTVQCYTLTPANGKYEFSQHKYAYLPKVKLNQKVFLNHYTELI